MPPAKKAAKTASAKHADPKHHDLKDLRRAYEHLGRVETLQKTSGQNDTDVSTLAALAEKQLKTGRAKDAADLLRAAEHFSFAALGATATKASELSPKLAEAVQKEFDHLLKKAEEHWEQEDEEDRHKEVAILYRTSLDAAKKARKHGSHRQALEWARGAEALAHVKEHGPEKLAAGTLHLKLGVSE